jgi:hypothetical protein
VTLRRKPTPAYLTAANKPDVNIPLSTIILNGKTSYAAAQ